MENLTKNQKISKSRYETRIKRQNQSCRVFEVKIQENKLNLKQKNHLKMLFVEAKWIWNDCLNWSALNENNTIYNYTLPKNTIIKKDKYFNDIEVNLKYIGSQMKQSLHDQIKANVKTLSTLKKNGYNIGKLKFKSEINSIDLKQHGVTYKICSNKSIKIQGIKGKIKCSGLNQIWNQGFEIANAKLLNKPTGYYLKVTCYKNKENETLIDDAIGIDLGISTTCTLSDGRKFNATVKESERLKRLQRKLSKSKKGSNNRWKLKVLIRKEYQKMLNKKNDLANKIVHEIKKYKYIFMQDEQLNQWKINFGKQVHHSVLGRIKSKLTQLDRTIVLNKWAPTTKLCFNCGQLHEMPLKQRTFSCDCGVESTDRDVHAAKNMILIGAGHTDFKPVEYNSTCLIDFNQLDRFIRRSRKSRVCGFAAEDIKSLA